MQKLIVAGKLKHMSGFRKSLAKRVVMGPQMAIKAAIQMLIPTQEVFKSQPVEAWKMQLGKAHSTPSMLLELFVKQLLLDRELKVWSDPP